MMEFYFTLEDVAKHNGLGGTSAWIIINDLIYDVTDYSNEHPGGGEILLEYAGKDGTAAFDDFGHSSSAKNILKSYQIGRLVKNDKAKTEMNNKSRTKQRKAKNLQLTNTASSNETRRKNKRSILRIVCGSCI